MWEKTEEHNERSQGWREEKISGAEEGGMQMMIGVVMVNMVEAIEMNKPFHSTSE